MKVWELMAKLGECKANADVAVAHNIGSLSVFADSVDTESDDDTIFIHGRGNFTVTEIHEEGGIEVTQPAKKGRK